MHATNLADLYELPPLEWKAVERTLHEGLTLKPGTRGPDHHSVWLTTINPDGSPHITGIGALWVDGTFWFQTGEHSRKGKNLARDPRCSLAVAADDYDIVVEGTAEMITDRARVADMASRYAAQGWPARVDESGTALTADYMAPSAGPPPWTVYRVAISRAMAVGTSGPQGATKWSFANGSDRAS